MKRLFTKMFGSKAKNNKVTKDVTIKEFTQLSDYLKNNPREKRLFFSKLRTGNLKKGDIDKIIKAKVDKEKLKKEIQILEDRILEIKGKRDKVNNTSETYKKELNTYFSINNNILREKFEKELSKKVNSKQLKQIRTIFNNQRVTSTSHEFLLFAINKMINTKKDVLKEVNKIVKKYKRHSNYSKIPKPNRLELKNFNEFKELKKEYIRIINNK